MISSNVVLDIERLEKEVEYFGNQGELAYDVETIDTSPGADDRGVPHRNVVTWVSMSTHGRTIVIPLGHPLGTRIVGEAKEPRIFKDGKTRMFRVPVYEAAPEQLTRSDAFPLLNKLFADPDVKKVAHGATFDNASVAKYRGGRIPAGDLFCSIVMRWLTDENRKTKGGYKLKSITKTIWGVAYDDENVGKCVEKHPLGTVAHYAYLDAKFAWLEFLTTRKIIQKEGLWDLLMMETELVSTLSHMRTIGVPIDEAKLVELRGELSVRVDRERRAVFASAGRELNLNAPRQKQALLFKPKSEDGLGLKPWKLTDGARKKKDEARKRGERFIPDWTSYSTDEESLEGFVSSSEVVRNLMAYQETSKVLSTYVLGYLGDEDDKEKPNRVFDGRVYPDLVAYAADTGRFGCRMPNLQNVPRPDTDLGKLIRGLFVATPGHKLIVCDYDQIELVLLAHFIGHGNLFDGFWNGIDPHVNTAAGAMRVSAAELQALVDAGDKQAKSDRQRYGKSINFATVFGAGISKLAAMMDVSPERAKEFKAAYDEANPEINAYRTQVLREARRQRPPHITTLMGRKRRLASVNSSDDGLRMYAERQLFNAKMQGSSADLTKSAMNRFMRMRQDNWQLLLCIHDELVVMVPDDEAEDAKLVLEEAMCGEALSSLLSVPLKAEAKIVNAWADAK
jgi:DNA polymerase I-like protein with 3'-5' exonuclease and polymerase domains